MDERMVAGRHHLSSGDRAYHQGHLDESRAHLDAALLQFRGPDLRLGEAHALRGLAQLEVGCGNLGLAEETGRHALACYGALRQQLSSLAPDAPNAELCTEAEIGEATTQVILGELFTRAGRVAEATHLLASAGVVLENLGGSALGAVQAAQARLALRAGDPPGARRQLTLALATYERVNDAIGQASVLLALGELDRLDGDLSSAERRLTGGLERARAIGTPALHGRSLVALAGLLLQQRRLPEASAAYREALPLLRHSGDTEIEGFALLGLGEVLSRSLDPAAVTTLVEGARLVGRHGHLHGLAGAMVRLGQHAVLVKDPELGLVAAECARRLFESTDPVHGAGQALRITVKALANLREWPATLAVAHWRTALAGATQPNAIEVQAFYRARAPGAWLAEIDRWPSAEIGPNALRMIAEVLDPLLVDLRIDAPSLGTVPGALAIVESFLRSARPPDALTDDAFADLLDELPTDALEELPPDDPPVAPIPGETLAAPARRRSVPSPLVAPPRREAPSPGKQVGEP